MVGFGRYCGEKQNDGSELAGFAMVWSENQFKVALAYGDSWRFIAGIWC